MGTRNLTMIRLNNELKLANYGGYDGYPMGEGAKIAAFVQANLVNGSSRAAFARKVAKLRAAAGHEAEGLEMPHGADILPLIKQGMPENLVIDDKAFFEDGLFCEWAYLIDLDRKVVEVYMSGKTLRATIEFKAFTPAAMPSLHAKLTR